jgi:hypothetical protein
MAKSGSARVVGWIEGTVPERHQTASPSTGQTWEYHIAPLIQAAGKFYIVDPLHDPIEVAEPDAVNQWMNRSMENRVGDHTEYRFIPPGPQNHAGMKTDHLKAMSADKVTASFALSRASLPTDFADSIHIDKALLDLSIFKYMIVQKRLGATDARRVVRQSTVPHRMARNALGHQLMLDTVPRFHQEHAPEVVKVAEAFGRLAWQRIEI